MSSAFTYLMYRNHYFRPRITKSVTPVCHNSYYEPDELERHWLMYLCSNM
jgi:hypothetical protein